MRIEQLDEVGASSEEEVALKAKRALVGAGARILFYPTLAYNVFRNKIQSEFRWWDRVDEFVLLGAVPFPSDVPHLRQLGVRGVVTLNEAYETLVPSALYKAHEIDHLVIPTRDYLFAPSFDDINRAVDFIHRNASSGKTTYVHCKAGRGRSTTIVLCYLIEHKNMTPEAALNHVRSIRPRVLLAPSQWQAVQEYGQQKPRVPSKSTETCCELSLIKGANVRNLAEDEEPSTTRLDLECFKGCFNEEDLILSFFQIALPSPPNLCSNNASGNEEGVFITEEDLDGFDMCTDVCKEFDLCVSPSSGDIQLQSPNGDDHSKPAIIRRLTCLFGALKVSTSCEPSSSPVAEIGAC
ncbi:dual specificity protein phosphatase family protein [Rhynchospora pubera]|uniref:phosphatidylglycerophosphatase n=1 Tax=Rhynchospora pubera TaxID=906938 RepID=A0AAV8DPL1_9POAL|nr:dual specificity protein phosphatase family protein [Rhynchospora pubera]KAJ4768525.1 dual specificity protein phosphatase family protein [Rhynchospora pubera]